MRLRRKILIKGLYISAICLVLILIVVFYSNWRVGKYSCGHTFENINDIPTNKVGLILGTSQYIKKGKLNPYFINRINAAVELYRAGKIHYIIVSGDNKDLSYNEPRMMKRELIKNGIPESAIILDFAGFRTLDSVIRCKAIFGQNSFTIISQKFHNERAVYIAHYSGISAVAYNSKDVDFPLGIKTSLREYLARVKVIIDVHFLKTQPKFLGDKIEIPAN